MTERLLQKRAEAQSTRHREGEQKAMVKAVSLCIIVGMICAAAVGLVSVLGRMDFIIQIRYRPRKRKSTREAKRDN